MPDRKPDIVVTALAKAYALAKEKVFPATVERDKAARAANDARAVLEREEEYLRKVTNCSLKCAQDAEALKAEFVAAGGYDHELRKAVDDLELQRAIEKRERRLAAERSV